MPTKRKLKDLRVNSVHLVSDGDNPEAHIALYKNRRDPTDEAETEALAKATAEEIEGQITTVEAAKEALLYIASLMHPDAPSDEAALFEYSKTGQGQETIRKVREAELPSRRDVEKAEGSEAPRCMSGDATLDAAATEIMKAEGCSREVALGRAATRDQEATGRYLEKRHAETWSPARRRASS